jgi:hypothetical protein
MPDLGRGTRLTPKAFHSYAVGGQVWMKYLHRYGVLHLHVRGTIDRTHAALTHLLVQAVFVVDEFSYQAIGAGLVLERSAV